MVVGLLERVVRLGLGRGDIKRVAGFGGGESYEGVGCEGWMLIRGERK